MPYENLWRATVTFDSTAPLTDEQAGSLKGHLADDMAVVIMVGHVPGDVAVKQDGRGTHLSMTVQASTLLTAQDAAHQAASAAYAATFDVVSRQVALQVLPEADYEAGQVRPAPLQLAGIAEIAEMAQVSRQRAQQLTLMPDFPPTVAVLKATKVYTRRSVELFLQRWPRQAGWSGHHAQAERDAVPGLAGSNRTAAPASVNSPDAGGA